MAEHTLRISAAGRTPYRSEHRSLAAAKRQARRARYEWPTGSLAVIYDGEGREVARCEVRPARLGWRAGA